MPETPPRLFLHETLSTWGQATFERTLKSELQQLDVNTLPLQRGLTQGSYASDDNLSVVILSVSEDSETIHAKAGIFYTGIIPGCQCADDPSPNNQVNEYCEVRVDIDKHSAACQIQLLD